MLNVAEVADRLRVSETTVYRFVSAGVLPAKQLAGPGSTIRVDARELESWLGNHESSGVSSPSLAPDVNPEARAGEPLGPGGSPAPRSGGRAL